jgi:hypothetical protein
VLQLNDDAASSYLGISVAVGLGSRVNKGENKGRSLSSPGPSLYLYLC